jgi:hypothetical protein
MLEERGAIDVRGKGVMQTWFPYGWNGYNRNRNIPDRYWSTHSEMH